MERSRVRVCVWRVDYSNICSKDVRINCGSEGGVEGSCCGLAVGMLGVYWEIEQHTSPKRPKDENHSQ